MAAAAIIVAIGTRPEAIKLMPVIRALRKRHMPVVVVSTAQHRELLDEALAVFGEKPDLDLGVMKPGQTLSYVTAAILERMSTILQDLKPCAVIVQGDTTTAFATALACHYQKIPLVHVEAGLRTHDRWAPFPEEFNRQAIGLLADLHAAPTARAMRELHRLPLPGRTVILSGNTVVDALKDLHERFKNADLQPTLAIGQLVRAVQERRHRLVLLTMHRRESFDGGIARAFKTISKLVDAHDDIEIVFPVHPNPKVKEQLAAAGFTQHARLHLIEPVSYIDLVYLLIKSAFVMTDSGGILEEAVSTGKRVIILREKTERMESCEVGYAVLVGTDPHRISAAFASYARLSEDLAPSDVFGDGYAADRIADAVYVLVQELDQKGKSTMTADVVVIGLGYIGLPMAVIMAEKQLQVVGYDVDPVRVRLINERQAPLVEPELSPRLAAIPANYLRASTALESAPFYIIGVPTPFTEGKKPDLSYVWSAADAIATVLRRGDCVILESTVPVGTTQQLADRLAAYTGMQAGIDFFVAHCPERVLPGKIFKELIENDRVIGGINDRSTEIASRFYQQFVTGALHATSSHAAEMVKLVENSSRDVQIAFAHQVASMAEAAGLNPYEIIDLANRHPRVQLLQPTCGVGGHCIAVDPWFLVDRFPKQTDLLRTARLINDARPLQVLDKIRSVIQNLEPHERIAICGLTYKPNVDDVRESPALDIAQAMFQHDPERLVVVEPMIDASAINCLMPGVVQQDFTTALSECGAVILLVKHRIFEAVPADLYEGKIVLDFCGLLYKSNDLTRRSNMETSHETALFGQGNSSN